MTPVRGRRSERGEERYRVRRVRGASFSTSRQIHRDLAVVVKRFPSRATRTGRDFVLVHGIGVSSRYFQPLAAELARHGGVHLVDLPGFGAAPKPRREVTLDDHAAVLASFLERSTLDDPVLVGHSMGTQVVATLAEQHPEVASRIVLMAPTMQPELRTPARAIAALLRDSLREPPVVAGIAVTDYLLRCGIPYLFRQFPNLLDDPLEERMARVTARTLVVNGDRDPIVSEAWARRIAGLAPAGEFHEVHGPHVIMHTAPEMVAAHIVEFAESDGSP